MRPRRYNGLFNGNGTAERRFLRALPDVARYINGKLKDKGYAVDVQEAELAINFITEGGYFVLTSNMVDGIDGFSYLGIDTIVDNYGALKSWLHKSVRQLVEGGQNTVVTTNEKGETVQSLSGLTLEQGLYANAGMYAWSKAVASKDIGARGSTLSTQPRTRQLFWATIYYNAGIGTGRKILDKHGVSYDSEPWPYADDAARYSRSARFNALWRTSSFEFALLTTYANGSPKAPPDENCSDGKDNDGDNLKDCDDDDCNGSSNCKCDSATCPDGCCLSGTCYPGTSWDYCGTGGIICAWCSENENCVDQKCPSDTDSGTPPPTDGGVGCGASNCTGCCLNDVCYLGNTNDKCGKGGQFCWACGGQEACVNGFCE